MKNIHGTISMALNDMTNNTTDHIAEDERSNRAYRFYRTGILRFSENTLARSCETNSPFRPLWNINAIIRAANPRTPWLVR